MDNKELRIGNLVTSDAVYSVNSKIFEVVGLPVDGSVAIRELGEEAIIDCPAVQILPLAISSPILVSLGLKEAEETWNKGYWKVDGRTYWFDGYELDRTEWAYSPGIEESCNEIFGESIHYIHSLQNLHYALSGVELVYSIHPQPTTSDTDVPYKT